MIAIKLSLGRESGIQPKHIVSTLARHGGVPAASIGRITINDGATLVDVHSSEASKVIGSSGELRYRADRLDASLA